MKLPRLALATVLALSGTLVVAGGAAPPVAAAAAPTSPCGALPAAGYRTTEVATGLDDPWAVDLDAAGRVFVTENGTGSAYRLTPSGATYARSRVGSAASYNGPLGIAVDGAGVVYVSEAGNNYVSVLDPAGDSYTERSSVPWGIHVPAALATDGADRPYVTAAAGEKVLALTPDPGDNWPQEVVRETNGRSPYGLTATADGTLYATAFQGDGTGEVVRSTRGGGGWAHTPVPVTGLTRPHGIAVDADGVLYVADTGNDRIVRLTPSGGDWSQETLPIDDLDAPKDVAVGTGGTLYVTDSGQGRVLRLDPVSVAADADTATTTAGTGVTTDVRTNDRGRGTDLATPTIAKAPRHGTAEVNPNGAITYTPAAGFSGTDTYRYAVRDSADPATVCAVATVTVRVSQDNACGPVGSTGGYGRTVVPTGVDYPSRFEIDADGNLFVADTDRGEIVRLTPSGSGYTRAVVATGVTGAFGIAIDDDGNLFVTSWNGGSVIRLAPSGPGYTRTTLATGPLLAQPSGIAVGPGGDLYVATNANSGNGRLVRLDAGAGYEPEVAATALSFPKDVAVDAAGVAYVATADEVVRVRVSGAGFTQDAVGTGLQSASGIAADPDGHLFVSDTGNDRILELTPSGAGFTQSTVPGWGDHAPTGLAVRDDGALVVADGSTNKLVVLGPAHVDAVDDTAATGGDGAVTTDVRANDSTNVALARPAVVSAPAHGTATVGADGTITYTPDAGWSGTDTYTYEVRDTAEPAQVCDVATVTVGVTAADGCAPLTSTAYLAPIIATHDLTEPAGIAVDSRRIVFISDPGDETVIGWGPGSGPSPVDSRAGLDPQGIAVDAAGNVFYADEGEHQVVMLTWDEAENWYTTRTVIAADLQRPSGVAVDADGNVYFAERGSGHVEKLTPSGGGYSQRTIAEDLDRPYGVAVDEDGRLFVADHGNDRIVRLTPAGDDYTQSVVSTSVADPIGVAVTPEGDVVVGDAGHRRLLLLVPNGSGYRQQEVPGWGTHTPTWVAAFDGAIVAVDQEEGEVAVVPSFRIDAVDDTASTDAPEPVTTDVAANDTGAPESVPLTEPRVTRDPAHGTASVAEDGSITYTPAAGFSGTDTYAYAISDAQEASLTCDAATVTVTVRNAFSDGPGATTPQNTPVTVPRTDVARTTGSPLAASAPAVVTQPQHGSAVTFPNGDVQYLPGPGYSGPDSFVVRVCDTATPQQCGEVTVPITVGDNTVTANDDVASTTVEVPVTTDVAENDLSESGEELAAPTIATPAAHGIVVTVEGELGYSPEPGFSGADSYTYGICDRSTPTPKCGTARVTVTVHNVFTTGAAVDTQQDTPVTTPLAVLGTTQGRPLDPAGVSAVTPPAHGSITVDPASGAVTYAPDTGYQGDDSYVVAVCDTSVPVQCDEATVTLRVAGTTAPTTRPTLTTRAPARATVGVDAAGRPQPVALSDRVTISGLRTGGTTTGRATLYGPVPRVSAGTCTPARAVATVAFTPVNGTVVTPAVRVTRPGYYTWVVTTSADQHNLAASHACGLASETTLVHRPSVGRIRVEAGFSGTRAPLASRAQRPVQVAVPALGMKARIRTVGARRGTMQLPGTIERGGWLNGSAAPGEAVGATVIAGHVSDRRDRPGPFGALRQARKGQLVKVRGADGTVRTYRITSVTTQPRGRGLTGAGVATTGAHRLTLVTCTGRVTYRNGRFHYTKNLVVTAVPIG